MKKLNFAQREELIQKVFDEQKYMHFSKLCVDTVKNTLVKYTIAQANQVILDKMREIAGLSDNPTAYEVKKAMKKNRVREAIFEIIEETVEDTLVSGWQDTPFFQQFVEYKSVALGNTNLFYVPDNTEIIISEVSASNHDVTRQRLGAGSETSVTTRYYGAKVYMETERYLMGVEDWGALIEKISRAYTQLINTLLYEAVMGAGATLTPQNQWNITCQMNESSRPDLVKLLGDVAIGTGSQPVLMGTGTALSGLTKMGKVDYLPESAKEEIYRIGRIGQFDQYKIIEIPQAFARNDTSKYLVDNNKILVAPGNIDKFVKMYDEGEMSIKEVSDSNTNMDATREYELVRKFGIAVMTNVRFGVVSIQA